MKTKIIMMTALLALLATGCGKDKGDGRIKIFAENMTTVGNAKLQIDPTSPAQSAQWLAGESIYINGTSKSISYNTTEECYEIDVEGINLSGGAYYAVYPGYQWTGNTWTVNNSTPTAPVITLTKMRLNFHNGVHDVVFPMGVKVDESSTSMVFKHLTAGFQLDLANNSAEDLVVKKLKVIVYGNGAAAPVAIDGVNYTVKWADQTTPAVPGGQTGNITDRNTENACEMNFDLYTEGVEGLTIAGNSSQKMCIPVTLGTVTRISIYGYNGNDEVFSRSSAIQGSGIDLQLSKMYPVKQIVVKQ